MGRPAVAGRHRFRHRGAGRSATRGRPRTAGGRTRENDPGGGACPGCCRVQQRGRDRLRVRMTRAGNRRLASGFDPTGVEEADPADIARHPAPWTPRYHRPPAKAEVMSGTKIERPGGRHARRGRASREGLWERVRPVPARRRGGRRHGGRAVGRSSCRRGIGPTGRRPTVEAQKPRRRREGHGRPVTDVRSISHRNAYSFYKDRLR